MLRNLETPQKQGILKISASNIL